MREKVLVSELELEYTNPKRSVLLLDCNKWDPLKTQVAMAFWMQIPRIFETLKSFCTYMYTACSCRVCTRVQYNNHLKLNVLFFLQNTFRLTSGENGIEIWSCQTAACSTRGWENFDIEDIFSWMGPIWTTNFISNFIMLKSVFYSIISRYPIQTSHL